MIIEDGKYKEYYTGVKLQQNPDPALAKTYRMDQHDVRCDTYIVCVTLA